MAMPPSNLDGYLSIDLLARAYRQGLSPSSIISVVFNVIEAYSKTQPAVWIHLNSRSAVLAAAKSLEEKYPDRDNRPILYGIPFSIKDNIDIASLPTTTACPPLTRYPTKSAPIFASLISAGALFIGKTNLEQLATGMTGCRSPYGTLHSKFHPSYIVGGSSSGSCVSVGANLVSFSIGSDTAGSGRLPAAFNGIVGWKPTKGTVSCVGITPACQSQDCVAVLAKNVADAKKVWEVIRGFDRDDVYAKSVPLPLRSAKPRSYRFGIPPEEALAVCSPTYRRMFDRAVKCIQGVGWDLHPFDWTPFEEAGKLLYEGTFVAERVSGLPEGWLEANASALHPVIRAIFEGAAQRKSTAIDVFRDMHAQQIYTRAAEKTFSRKVLEILLVPTAPSHPTISSVLADPIAINSALGHFAHFANVVDLCAVAVPAGTYPVSELAEGDTERWRGPGAGPRLPFGVTILAGRGRDEMVLEVARTFEEAIGLMDDR